MLYKSGYEWYINKPSEYRWPTGLFGGCKWYWSRDFWHRVWEKEKSTFVFPKERHPSIFFLSQGITERCVAQKEPQTLGWIGTPATPGRPDVTEGRPKQSQEARRANRQHVEGEDENGGFKAYWLSGRRDQAESTCTYTCLPEMPEVRSIRPIVVFWFLYCRKNKKMLSKLFKLMRLFTSTPDGQYLWFTWMCWTKYYETVFGFWFC